MLRFTVKCEVCGEIRLLGSVSAVVRFAEQHRLLRGSEHWIEFMLVEPEFRLPERTPVPGGYLLRMRK